MTQNITTETDFVAAVAQAQAAAAVYYDGAGSQVMTDAEYDTLVDAIEQAHTAHPTWDDAGVLDAVAAGASAGGDVTHPEPMLSLAKTKTLDAVAVFTAGLPAVVVEPKMDGMAVRAEYTAGRLTLVATRGDGTTGENVTAQATRIAGLPATVASGGTFEIRGEVYMTDADFEQSNENRIASGKPGFANPRNATAGSLRREDSDYATPMSFAAYDASGNGFDQPTYHARMAAAADQGFGTAATLLAAAGIDPAPTTDADTVLGRINALEQARATLGFPIDGAVIKVDAFADRDRLGFASRTPRWATSYKYAADTTTTVVTAVETTIGRTGRIGIRLVVEPVSVGGTTITYAAGHNPDWMLTQKMGVGTKVSLYRAGDVIPRAVALPDDQQPDTATVWTPPAVCPQCGEEWDKSSLLWRCHTPECSLAGALTYWCSRDAMDVERAGESVCEALAEQGLASSVADLYDLTADDLAALPMGTTSTGAVRMLGRANAEAIIAELDKSKSQPFNRVITGLGIRMTGRSVGRWLAAEFGTMAALRAATVEDVAAIDRLGDIKAAHIVAGLAALGPVIDRLAAAGVNMGTDTVNDDAPLPLTGKTYVVSGSVPGYTRTTINERIEALGGKASSSVSRNTTALVTSETTTSKAVKAANLGIPVIDPAEFATLIA